MTDNVNVPNINNIILSGRLTSDSEIRYLNDNTSVLNFRIASTRRYQDKQGEWKEDTLFINIDKWGSSFNERLSERLKTGVPVIVQGSLRLNTWEDKNTGQKRSTYQIRAFRVHILVKNTENQYRDNEPGSGNINNQIDKIDKEFNEIADNENIGGDDDIPF